MRRQNPPGGGGLVTNFLAHLLISSPKAIGFDCFLPAVVQVSQNYDAASPETEKIYPNKPVNPVYEILF